MASLIDASTRSKKCCEFEDINNKPCRRRLDALDRQIACICGKIFCKMHREFPTHSCGVSRLELQRARLQQELGNNPNIKTPIVYSLPPENNSAY